MNPVQSINISPSLVIEMMEIVFALQGNRKCYFAHFSKGGNAVV